MKIAIIGSGISGVSLANMLRDRHEVFVFEKQNKQGGLIKCDYVDSVLFHKVGGHVFNSKNQEVLNWFWSRFDRDSEFISVKRKAKILFGDKIIGYPIENYIYNLDKNTAISIINELTELEKKEKINPLDYPNFEEFLKNNFGDTLYNIYFKPYNTKVWKTDLSTIPMRWLEGKLPMPDFKEIITSNIVREEEAEMVHSSFYYPKNGGSQFIIDKLAVGLNVMTNKYITHIEKQGEHYIIAGISGFDKIIYCGDVRNMPDYMDQVVSSTVDLQTIKTFRANGTSNLLCEVDADDMSWLYIPEDFTSAHRIIYTGNFANSNNGNRSRKTCVVEFSGKVDYKTMVSEITKLPGNLAPITFNYEPNSYIIHDKQTAELINSAKVALREQNIYLLGRFAEWEYYNMDKCIEAAMALAAELN